MEEGLCRLGWQLPILWAGLEFLAAHGADFLGNLGMHSLMQALTAEHVAWSQGRWLVSR